MFYSKEVQPRHWPNLSTIIYKTDPVVGTSFSAKKSSKFSFKPTKTLIQSKRLTQLVIVMLYHLELLFFVSQKNHAIHKLLRKETQLHPKNSKKVKTSRCAA